MPYGNSVSPIKKRSHLARYRAGTDGPVHGLVRSLAAGTTESFGVFFPGGNERMFPHFRPAFGVI